MPNPTKIEIGAGLAILAIVAVVMGVRSTRDPGTAPAVDRALIERQAMETRTRQLEDATFTICHDAVQAGLKSPSTATIRSTHLSFASTTGTALLQVDAQNGFGAMVREVFDCQTQMDSGMMRITSLIKVPS